MTTLIRYAFVVAGLLFATGASHGQFLLYRSGFSNFGLGGLAFPSATAFNATPFSLGTFDLAPSGVFGTFGASPFGVQTFGATPALGLTSYRTTPYGIWGRRRGFQMPSLPGNIIVSGGGSSGGGGGTNVAERFDRIDQALGRISDTLERIRAKLDGGAAPSPAPDPKLPALSPDNKALLDEFHRKFAEAEKNQAAANKAVDDLVIALAKPVDDATKKQLQAELAKAIEAKIAATKAVKDLNSKLKP